MEAVASIVAAAGFMGGFLLFKHACRIDEEVSSMRKVQFRDFHELRDHLWNCPGREAKVLVEGKVEKLNNGAISENTEIEGAALISSTEIQESVYEGWSWCKTFRTIVHVNDSVPFKLVDTQGNWIRVESVHRAQQFQGLLRQVFKQEKALPGGLYSKFDDTSVTVPTFSTMQDNALVFGTNLAGYGRAVLTESSHSGAGGEEITFTPEEVDKTIVNIIKERELKVQFFRKMSVGCLLIPAVVILERYCRSLIKNN